MYNNFLLLLVVLMISCSEDNPPIIEGCTDDSACNYDSNATADDNSCISPIECNLCNPCDLASKTISILNESELWYNISEDISGFQLDIYGITISDVSFSDIDYSDFTIDYINGTNFSRILVYSTIGSSIPSGCGVLLDIISSGEATNVEVIFGNSDAEVIEVTYQNCFSN